LALARILQIINGFSMTRPILITGGAGYIGSQTVYCLLDQGLEMVVLDSLENGHAEFLPAGVKLEQGSLLDEDFLNRVFSQNKFAGVIHFAAYINVAESIQNPQKYFKNNVVGTLNLLTAMHQHGVQNLVFSSTCATYGIPEHIPLAETAPQNPINPYGESKLLAEKIIRSFCGAYGLNAVILRYFNAAGADLSHRTGEAHQPETHLIPNILAVAGRQKDRLTVFGSDYDTPDGTCIRDYIHTVDLASAHLLALNYLHGKQGWVDTFNLGSGIGYSVLEIVKAVEKVTGRSIELDFQVRREGDPDKLICCNTKAKTILNWQPKLDLEQIVSSAWDWYTYQNSPVNSQKN
jgi:UDP-glucose 4-epimerase